MNAFSAFGAAAVMATMAASPAFAFVSQPQTLRVTPLIVKSDFVQGHEAVAGIPARQALARAETTKVMAQRYFDVDMIVTLGALALASGAFVAVGVAGGRRRAAEKIAASPREGWRNEVMQALEADLAQFTLGLRQAA